LTFQNPFSASSSLSAKDKEGWRQRKDVKLKPVVGLGIQIEEDYTELMKRIADRPAVTGIA